MRATIVVLTVVVLCSVYCGCGAPVVTVVHTLPAAVPLPADFQEIRAGHFTVRPEPYSSFGDVLAEMLQPKLADLYTTPPVPSRTADVHGEVLIAVEDVRDRRMLRRGNPAAGPMQTVEVSTLVRTAEVTVVFQIQPETSREILSTVECRRSYHSAEDPRLRGELGLDRPLDPAAVPETETILTELLAECIESFCGMLTPPIVTEQLALRPAPLGPGSEGLHAAAKENYSTAAEHFMQALETRPGDIPLLWNLAVVEEASGKLDLALEHYQQVAEKTQQQDTDALEAIRRVQRIIAFREALSLGSESTHSPG